MNVIVIGASAPGLFTAYLLAKRGLEVEVYERSDAIGMPPRTLIVTEKINDVLGFRPEAAILNEVRYVELFSKSKSARLELKRPDLIIERSKLIRLLAEMAESAGAEIKLNCRFLGYTETSNKLVVSIKNLATGAVERVNADVLIGADGAFSAVSRAALRDGHALASLLQARVRLPQDVSQDTFRVWFDAGRTKYFYWLIPESCEAAAVGLIADDARQAGASLKAFLTEHELEPLEFQGAMAPVHRFEYLPKFAAGAQRVFLIGDAAAQMKVTTVGGVVAGLRGARAVADAILKRNGYRGKALSLKLELDLHLLLRQMLNKFTDEDYDALLGMLNGKMRWLLSSKTRDELASTFLKLITAEPKLLILGAKALSRSLY
jgi:flavin-dependent dehydrogenase